MIAKHTLVTLDTGNRSTVYCHQGRRDSVRSLLRQEHKAAFAIITFKCFEARQELTASV